MSDQPDDVCRCLPLLRQELWVVHHLLQEADDPQLQLHVELKVLRGDSSVNGGQERMGGPIGKKWDDAHLRVFGHPVTQHIQHPVGGRPPDHKLFVPVSLVSGETWSQGSQKQRDSEASLKAAVQVTRT